MTNKISIVINILCFCYYLTSCTCANKLAKCPDSRPVSFPKNSKCAKTFYEDAVKNFDFNLKATVNVIDQVTVGVDNLGIKNDAKLLKDQLDNESIRLQETLKASYLALVSDPCGNGERHYQIVSAVNDKNYKLQEIKSKLESSKTNEEIKNTIDEYSRGKEDGINMGILIRTLEKYYFNNKKFPYSLSELAIDEILIKLGNSRLEYKLKSNDEFVLKFAGADYLLNTSDDKVYKGDNGKAEEVN